MSITNTHSGLKLAASRPISDDLLTSMYKFDFHRHDTIDFARVLSTYPARVLQASIANRELFGQWLAILWPFLDKYEEDALLASAACHYQVRHERKHGHSAHDSSPLTDTLAAFLWNSITTGPHVLDVDTVCNSVACDVLDQCRLRPCYDFITRHFWSLMTREERVARLTELAAYEEECAPTRALLTSGYEQYERELKHLERKKTAAAARLEVQMQDA